MDANEFVEYGVHCSLDSHLMASICFWLEKGKDRMASSGRCLGENWEEWLSGVAEKPTIPQDCQVGLRTTHVGWCPSLSCVLSSKRAHGPLGEDKEDRAGLHLETSSWTSWEDRETMVLGREKYI